MSLADRIAEYVPRLPAELRQLFDAELAAGNEINDVELGRGADQGRVAVVLNHPFRCKHAPLPAGITYREISNRDLLIFEYYTADERFSLVTAKFKPMVLDTSFHGPESPNEAHAKEMERYAHEVEAAAAQRAKQAADAERATEALRAASGRSAGKTAAPSPDSVSGDAGRRFIASMNITYEMWHDGIGYDLDALAQATPADRSAIESILIHHEPRDWRDIEALARIDTASARATVEAALKSSDAKIRREAMQYVGDKADPREREEQLIKTLQTAGLFDGLSAAIDEVEEFHPPAVIETLLRGALNRDGEAAIHFAAMLFFLHGKADEAFDWKHRPFFLRFETTDRAQRKAVFRELCETIGVDAGKYVR